MNKHEIENRIARGVEEITPDIYEKIKNIPPAGSASQESEVLTMKTPKKSFYKTAALLVCAAAIFIAVLGISRYRQVNAVDSIIGIDVNPSVELTVSKSDKILNAAALNEDGKKVLADMKLKGIDLDIAVNALIGSMVKHGYFDDLDNSILVTVKNNNDQKAEALKSNIITDIQDTLAAQSLSAEIYNQTISDTSDETIESLARQYNISYGKALFLQNLVSKDSSLRFEDLAHLTVREIALLAESRKIDVSDLIELEADDSMAENIEDGIEDINEQKQESIPSDPSYITLEEAKKIALAVVADASVTKAKLEEEDGRAVYEIELKKDDMEYDFEIDAITGKILKQDSEKEHAGTTQPEKNQPGSQNSSASDSKDTVQNQTKPADNTGSANSSGYIGKKAAEKIALAEVPDAAVRKNKLDADDNPPVYEIELYKDNMEYDFEIDAVTGKILKQSSEKEDSDDDHTSSSKPNTSGSQNSYIGKEAAKKIALAKVPGASVIKNKLDTDDGRAVYEIELLTDTREYDFEIDAVTGEILKQDSEKRDNDRDDDDDNDRDNDHDDDDRDDDHDDDD